MGLHPAGQRNGVVSRDKERLQGKRQGWKTTKTHNGVLCYNPNTHSWLVVSFCDWPGKTWHTPGDNSTLSEDTA